MHEWGAVGFRSGFMFHNLEWAHDWILIIHHAPLTQILSSRNLTVSAPSSLLGSGACGAEVSSQ